MFIFKHLFSKPNRKTFIITSSNGFHLRPVAKFVSVTKRYTCQITATFQGKTVDAKTINTLLTLSLEKGDAFTLTTKGKDAQEALETLHSLFETLMQDDKEVKEIKKERSTYEGSILEGEIISEGIAMAPLHHHSTKEVKKKSNLSFQEALAKSLEELEILYLSHQKNDHAEIFLAQKELLASLGEKSPSFLVFEEEVEKASQELLGSKLESKISDYQDLLQRVKKHLGIIIHISFPDTPFILVASDLLPSEIDSLVTSKISGVILKETSTNSHTAILLRGAGITSLIADTAKLSANTPVILDTHAGVVVQTPSSKDIKKATLRLKKDKANKLQASTKRFEPAVTHKGRHIKVFANITDLDSANIAREEGAEGVGLLRSEFLFKKRKPTLEAQTQAYKEIFSLFDDLTIRTLDIGGDKALPYIELPREKNPFLGIRGVRLFQTHPHIMAEQLQAIFLASENRSIKVMFPMVSSVEEFKEAKALAHEVASKHQLDISHVKFGIMIEVPSVLFLIEVFNDVVDFYSIGTNDLTQYLFAIERTHTSLKTDPLSPVIFDAIASIVQKATKPVSICGELAANSQAIEKLIHCGIETLSVSAKSIAKTKEDIRKI